MRNSDKKPSENGPVRRWALALSVGTGRLVAVVGPLTLVALLGGWLFVTDREARYDFMLRGIGALAVLVVLVALCSAAAGRVRLSDAYAYAAGEAEEVRAPSLPARLPGGWFARYRKAAFWTVFATMLVGWFALLGGAWEATGEVAEINKDGTAVVRTVEIEDLGEVQFRDLDGGYYFSEAEVELDSESGCSRRRIEVVTEYEPHVGDLVTVLYSTRDADRGVLSGSAAELREQLAGGTVLRPGGGSRWPAGSW